MPLLFSNLCTAGALLAVISCAAPPREVTPQSVVASVAGREDVAVLEAALELLPASARDPLLAPTAEVDDPAHPDFWRARALAFQPEVRAARSRWSAAAARAPGAGAPGPVELGVGNRDFAGKDRETDVMVTFDLLGLLRVGPAAAARALADADSTAALADLEAAAWAACFTTDRALVRCAAALDRERAIQQLQEESAADRRRIDTYAELGWIPAAELHAASGALDSLDLALAAERVALAAARRDLAVTTGLAPGAAAFGALSPRFLEGLQPEDASVSPPDPALLLERVPRLRALRLELAVAEARLRKAAAERWPTLRAGPQWRFTPGTVLPGGLLSLDVPFPGSQEPAIRAAQVERDRAVESIEEGLVETQAALDEARTRNLEAQRVLKESAATLRASATASWTAGRADFGVDARTLMRWSQALDAALRAQLGWITARESAALAALDWRELSGQLEAGPLPEASP